MINENLCSVNIQFVLCHHLIVKTMAVFLPVFLPIVSILCLVFFCYTIMAHPLCGAAPFNVRRVCLWRGSGQSDSKSQLIMIKNGKRRKKMEVCEFILTVFGKICSKFLGELRLIESRSVDYECDFLPRTVHALFTGNLFYWKLTFFQSCRSHFFSCFQIFSGGFRENFWENNFF